MNEKAFLDFNVGIGTLALCEHFEIKFCNFAITVFDSRLHAESDCCIVEDVIHVPVY